MLLAGCGPDLPDPPEPVPDGSLYELTGSWTDQRGGDARLDVWRGHPTLVSMIYTSCPVACPTLIQDTRRLRSDLSEDAREHSRVLLVSLDPDRDGPQELGAIATAYALEEDAWSLMVGTPDQTRAFGAALGVEFAKRADGEMDHTTLITLVDPEGVPVETAQGATRELGSLKARLEGFAAARTSP